MSQAGVSISRGTKKRKSWGNTLNRAQSKWALYFCFHLRIKVSFQLSQERIKHTVLNGATVAFLPCKPVFPLFSCVVRVDRFLPQRNSHSELRLIAAFESSDFKSIHSIAAPVSFCFPTVNGTWTGITSSSLCPLRLYYHWLSWNSWVSMNIIKHYY